MEVTNVGDIKLQIEKVKKEKILKKDTIQPLLAIVVKDDIPVEFYVYVENVFYKYTSFILAFDSLFKVHQSLNLSYAKEAYNFWYFIQKCINNISTKYDKAVSAVSNLITQLKFAK